MIDKIVDRSINLHKNPRSGDKRAFQKLYIQRLNKLKSIEKWQRYKHSSSNLSYSLTSCISTYNV